MLSKERMYRIINILEEKSFVTVKELMDEFQISRSSIMRDLIELENQGLIQRERGGAVKKDVSVLTLSTLNEQPVINKENLYIKEKQAICKNAAQHIKDGDCIYIDSGTTPVYLLSYISDKRVKIITPSTYLIRKLPNNFRGDIYLLGGEFKKSYDMSFGPLTLEMINQFNFDHAFFSTNGVDLKNGEVFIFEFSIGAVKRAIMKRCFNNYLLIDSSKFDIKALCTWSHIDDFDYIYTNEFTTTLELPDNLIMCDINEL